MIGTSITQTSSNGALSTSYIMIINPASITETTSNGSYSAPAILCTVQNYTGPIDFDVSHSSNVAVELTQGEGPQSNRMTIQASFEGSNQTLHEQITVTCIDTGNANLEIIKTIDLIITFE